jgi:hypothetical protein
MINRDIEGDTQWNQFSEEFAAFIKIFKGQLPNLEVSQRANHAYFPFKMNMNFKVASVLGISDDGIRKVCYRLRKRCWKRLTESLLGFS